MDQIDAERVTTYFFKECHYPGPVRYQIERDDETDGKDADII
ncbi:MAG: hypothetical protein WC346_07220 [Methanogenium sp.]